MIRARSSAASTRYGSTTSRSTARTTRILANVDFREAFAWSCNRTFALTGLELGTERLVLAMACRRRSPGRTARASAQRLDEYAGRFWIGKSVPFDLPVEAGQLKGGGEWYPSLLAQTAFGQGELAATPLQMALAAAVIANGGAVLGAVRRQRGARSGWGGDDPEPRPGTLGQAISAKAAQTMNEMMVLSVDTAWAKPAAIAGVKVGGKAGTAEAPRRAARRIPGSSATRPPSSRRWPSPSSWSTRGRGTDFATPGREAILSALERALERSHRQGLSTAVPAGTSLALHRAKRRFHRHVRDDQGTPIAPSSVADARRRSSWSPVQPPLRDVSSGRRPRGQSLDPDAAGTPYEPVRPAEAPRKQAPALVPSPRTLAMIGTAFASAFIGGAIGFWLGKRPGAAASPTDPPWRRP